MPHDVAKLCEEIREYHRGRVFAMSQRMRVDLSMGDFLRRSLGWRRDAVGSPENKRAADQAKAILKAAAKAAKTGDQAALAAFGGLGEMAYISALSARAFVNLEATATREMERRAKLLPVWAEFGKGVSGFGARSLAVIVAEAGDLSNYASEAKLWKRLGVAVMGAGDGFDDHRQGHPGANASKADWIAEGYSRRRRSQMFVIGEALMQAAGPYHKIYLARKAYEVARAEDLGLIVCPAPEIPEKSKALYRSQRQIHRRAHRYMEKRLLRHLWAAWRRCAARGDGA